jgi:hypothetical protein
MYNYQKRLTEEVEKAIPQKDLVLTEGLLDYIKNAFKKEPLLSQIMALRSLKGKISKAEYDRRVQAIKDTAIVYLMKASGVAALGVTLAHRTGMTKVVDKVVHHFAKEPGSINEIDHILHSILTSMKLVAHYEPEGEMVEATTTSDEKAKAYDSKIWDAMTRVKMIKDKAKHLGVRVQTDGKTATCIKEFPKGDSNAFRAAYDACYSVICLFKFTKNTNLWGCSTAGFGAGAQECIKNGRIVLNKSGDGAQLQFRGLERGLYLSNGTKAF